MTQQDRGDQQDYNSPVQQSLPQPQQYMRSSDPTASILHAGPGSGHAAPQSLVQQHHQQQQQQHQQQQQQTVPAHHHAAATTASMMMDPSQMGGHHPDPHSAHHSHARMDPGQPQHYGPPPGPVMAPLYHQHMQATQPPTQHQTHISTGSKRPRPDDLDLHAPTGPLGSLDHAQLTGMHPHTHPHHVSMTGYGPATTAAGHGHVPAHTQHHHHSQQHHHRLPHSEPVPKLMRRDEPVGMMASSSSVVGQEGMPEPAKRPKGPKLKFTTDDDQLLIELKEKKNLTWKQIADFFPGRSSGTLQVRYCTKLKAKTKQWNRDMDSKLRTALNDYENDKWRIVSSKLGTGFTPAACRERANDLWGGEHPVDLEEGVSSPAPETASQHSEDVTYTRPMGQPLGPPLGQPLGQQPLGPPLGQPLQSPTRFS